MTVEELTATVKLKKANMGLNNMTSDNWDAIADDEQEWGAPINGGKKRNKQDTVVTVRLPSAVASQARSLASQSGLTLSAFLREIVTATVTASGGSSGGAFALKNRTMNFAVRPTQVVGTTQIFFGAATS